MGRIRIPNDLLHRILWFVVALGSHDQAAYLFDLFGLALLIFKVLLSYETTLLFVILGAFGIPRIVQPGGQQ